LQVFQFSQLPLNWEKISGIAELAHVPEIEHFEERRQWTASPPLKKSGSLDKPLCLQELH